jgi:hypothetical protein
MMKSFVRPSAVALLALLATSCSSAKRLEYCPGMSSVLDAVVATQFKPGVATDPANALYMVKVVNVTGNCSYDKKGHTSDSDIDIEFQATRPSPGAALQYTVPYFVAVTQATRVITRTTRQVTFGFDTGATTASFTEHVSSIALVTDGDKKPYDYEILVGLQLTKAQLDYNRSIGIFQQ